MKTYRKFLETLTRDELIEEAISRNEFFLKYDKFLAEELGEVTYNDIVKRFAIKGCRELLEDLGADEEDIQEFERESKNILLHDEQEQN